MNIGKRIKKLRESLGLTQEEFGLKAGLSSGAICEIEKGIRGHKKGVGSNAIIRICKEFNINPAWLLWGKEEKYRQLPIIAASPKSEYDVEKKLTAIPVINEVPIGYPEYPILNDFIREYLYLPHVPKFAFGLYVSGKSMDPEIFDGDIVIVDSKTRKLKRGNLGVFRINNETSLKRYYPQKNGILLQPTNPEYPPILITVDDQCDLIGKVIYKILKC